MRSCCLGPALLLAACGAADAPRAQPSPIVPAIVYNSFEGQWRIVTLDGRPVVNPNGRRDPAITIDHTGYGANAGCNDLGGLGVLVGDRYFTMVGPQTVMGCLGDAERQERLLSALMRASPTVAIGTDGGLTLAGGGHRLTARRDPAFVAPPREPAPLLAGWRLAIMGVDDTYLTPRNPSERQTLAFDADGWQSRSACGTLSGNWRQEGWRLTARTESRTAGACPADDAAFDVAIRAVFSGTPRFATGSVGTVLIAGNGHRIFAERDPSETERAAPDLKGAWDVVAIDGQPPRTFGSGPPPQLYFGASAYGGATGCTTAAGGYLVRSARVYTNPRLSTDQGCGALRAQEERMLTLLREAPRVARTATGIRLLDARGGVDLRRVDRAVPALATARPLPVRYASAAFSVNGASTRIRRDDPPVRLTLAGEDLRIDIGCGEIRALVKRRRGETRIVTFHDASDGSRCSGARREAHERIMRLANGPVSGSVDSNDELLLAGDDVWLAASPQR